MEKLRAQRKGGGNGGDGGYGNGGDKKKTGYDSFYFTLIELLLNMIENLNRVLRELRNTPIENSRQFNLDVFTRIARLTPLSYNIHTTHPHYMDHYRRILVILNSASDIAVSSPAGVISYIMTPQNREPVLYHLQELYAILIEIASLVAP